MEPTDMSSSGVDGAQGVAMSHPVEENAALQSEVTTSGFVGAESNDAGAAVRVVVPDLTDNSNNDDDPPFTLRERTSARRHPKQLDEAAVKVLHQWMFSPDHFDHPYPTGWEQEALSEKSGLTLRQVVLWFTNARKRIWAPMRRERGLSVPTPAERMRAQALSRRANTSVAGSELIRQLSVGESISDDDVLRTPRVSNAIQEASLQAGRVLAAAGARRAAAAAASAASSSSASSSTSGRPELRTSARTAGTKRPVDVLEGFEHALDGFGGGSGNFGGKTSMPPKSKRAATLSSLSPPLTSIVPPPAPPIPGGDVHAHMHMQWGGMGGMYGAPVDSFGGTQGILSPGRGGGGGGGGGGAKSGGMMPMMSPEGMMMGFGASPMGYGMPVPAMPMMGGMGGRWLMGQDGRMYLLGENNQLYLSTATTSAPSSSSMFQHQLYGGGGGQFYGGGGGGGGGVSAGAMYHQAPPPPPPQNNQYQQPSQFLVPDMYPTSSDYLFSGALSLPSHPAQPTPTSSSSSSSSFGPPPLTVPAPRPIPDVTAHPLGGSARSVTSTSKPSSAAAFTSTGKPSPTSSTGISNLDILTRVAEQGVDPTHH